MNTDPVPAGERSPAGPDAFTAFTAGAGPVNSSVNAEQIRSNERALSAGTWLIVFGAMLYSVLTVTPLMREHTPKGWEWTAPILPLVVDAAVVIVVRLDALLARLGQDGGGWPLVLRWMTGIMTLSLNVGRSAADQDWGGVAVHAVAPLLLIVTAETGLAYRRAITRALAAQQRRQHAEQAAREHAARQQAEARQAREQEEREYQARMAREQREHEAALARQEAEHRERLAAEERRRTADAERERQAERERAARERQQAERERAEAQAREREREQERQRAEQQRAERDERRRQRLLAAGPAPAKLPEEQARQIVTAAFLAGLPVRAAAQRCGWSIGWVAGRYQELREHHPNGQGTEPPRPLAELPHGT
ncbi:hypothetical protein [Actinomadura fibrosa]|uniref:DUF2637 domain-containing protein n=1 Tax=Actinomadura fibrosa TaxID=111802 RepID=A0ABW2XNY0_9ACTN|nr:hypothetical protein [Actinomadura fibrosa]